MMIDFLLEKVNTRISGDVMFLEEEKTLFVEYGNIVS